MNQGYRYGQWNKNPEITRSWSKSDYLINNNEIMYSQAKQLSLGKLTGRQSFGIRAFLYAIFFLQQQDPDKKGFIFQHIYDMAKKKETMIKILIKKKGENQIIPQAWKFRYNRSNGSFDVDKKIIETINQFSNELIKTKISKETLYFALAWTSGVFIEIQKNKANEEKYAYSGAFPTNGGTEFIHLTRDGKELMEKYIKYNYLL